MNNEIWIDILGYEGLYQVSDKGRVRRITKSGKTHILKNYAECDGYEKVALYIDATPKRFTVHRLVAEAFIPNPDNLPQINHINSDRGDNRVENLEWCTPSKNIDHAYKHGYKTGGRMRKVKNINTGKIFNSAKDASESYGVRIQDIYKSTVIGYNVKGFGVFEFVCESKANVPIICNETGKVFNNIKEAASELGCHPSAVSGHINHNRPKSVKGYTFRKK